MTSRPALGAQPPLQRNASAGFQQRPPLPQQRSRSAVYTQDASAARLVGSSVIDLTSDGEAKPVAGAGWPQQLNNGGNGAGSAISGLLNAQGKFARPTLPNLVLNDGSSVSYENDTYMAVDGRQSGTSSPRPAAPCLPLPQRPPPRVAERTLAFGDVKIKPDRKPERAGTGYALEKPESASRFSDGRPIDFNAWSGHGPEDNLSVHIVERGFVDAQAKVTDLSTARTNLYPHMKKGGLTTLSQLFVQTLEKRQILGRVSTPLQFKLPGRIAQSDKRKEMWVKELADTNVPLRRLSARIPHGIKGPILLEQCLSKGVPVARAVWLARCIGVLEMALEARARQRTAGGNTIASANSEAKWIREWTAQVQQFIYNTVKSCGEEGWKKRIDYVIRLSSHLYAGRLLDRPQFLDWIFSSLSDSSLDELPVWLLFAEIYWQDATASRRRGCRLTTTLLNHVSTISSKPKATEHLFHPLLTRLRAMLTSLITKHKNCLILPESWPQYSETVQQLASYSTDVHVLANTINIKTRNQRLVAAGRRRTDRSPSARLIRHLDSLDVRFNIKTLCSDSLNIIPSHQDALSILLRWATSIYRTGDHRIYVATRVTRKWLSEGIDTDSIITSFLASLTSAYGVDFNQVRDLIAGLVLQRQFSFARYMQWLIATGALQDETDNTTFSHARLVAALPVTALPSHVANLRETMLVAAGLSVRSDEDETEAAKAAIQARLPNLFRLTGQTIASWPTFDLIEVATPVKYEITRWLRHAVVRYNNIIGRIPTKSDPSNTEEVAALTSTEFFIIRNILERLQDFPILADILAAVTTSTDSTVLAAVAATLSFHALTFAVIGAFVPICDSLVSRYMELRLQRPPDRIFTSSLLSLCNQLPDQAQTVRQLKADLSRCDQRTAIAMCSPASDNMMDVRDATGLTPDEEIERILASGNSMDEQNFKRIFARITSRVAQAASSGETLALDRLRGWFYRLRAFDDKIFDRLLKTWLTHLASKMESRTIGFALGPLLSSGCISMAVLWDYLAGTGNTSAVPARVLLEVFLPCDTPVLALSHDAYLLGLERKIFCVENRTDVLGLLHRALLEVPADPKPDALSLCLAGQHAAVAVLKQFLIRDPRAFGDAVTTGEKTTVNARASESVKALQSAFTKSLLATDDAVSVEQQIKYFVGLADDLSLPFCQLELRLIQAFPQNSSEGLAGAVQTSLLDAVKDAIDSNRPIWVDLLEGLDVNVAQHVCQHAQSQLLLHQQDMRSEPDPFALDRYLAVVDATASSLPASGQPNVAALLRERVKGIQDVLSASANSSEQAQKPVLRSITAWLDVYLHLALVHKASLLSPKATQSDRTSFILDLASLLVHPELQRSDKTITCLYDVLAWFSDDLNEDTTTHLGTFFNRHPTLDPRLAFIFAVKPPQDSWLSIVSTPQSNSQPTPSTRQPQSPHPQTQLIRPGQQSSLPPRPQPPARNVSAGFWSSQNVAAQAAANRAGNGGGISAGSPTTASEPKETKPIPFPLRPWEILPEFGVNDTALALTLFGARKVL